MAGDADVLFWLEAYNKLSQEIIDDNTNSFYRVKRNGRHVLRVVLSTTPKIPGTLLSFGRSGCDVTLPNNHMWSKEHCYFYLNTSSSVLILRDRSGTQSTQVALTGDGELKKYRLQGAPRQRALLPTIPVIVYIGKAVFRIVWRVPRDAGADESLEQAKKNFAQRPIPPELALTDRTFQTRDKGDYDLRSQYTPTVASQYDGLPRIVHEKVGYLGAGAFGTVHKTVDLDTGRVFAVKTSNRLINDDDPKKSMKEEVEVLSKLSHVSVYCSVKVIPTNSHAAEHSPI
jgi:hypothetical protein